MEVIKKIGSVVLSVILWIIILTAALYAFVTLATRDENRIASIAGYSPLVVQSDSMVPTFETDDLIFIKQVNPETLEVGDVVTFHTIIENEYALNTHRIVDIVEENGMRHYTTQGDNNAISDTHIITDGDIVGKYVSRLPKVGKVMNFLSGKIGFLLVIVLPMLLFFIYQVYHLIMVAIELKKATALEAAMEAEKLKEEMRERKAEKRIDKSYDEEEETSAFKSIKDDEADAVAAARSEAEKARAEAEKALAEAQRMKEEAEKALAEAKAKAGKE